MTNRTRYGLVGGLTGLALVTFGLIPMIGNSQYTTSLEERVRLLENQTALLTQRVTNLERGGPVTGGDGIRRPFTGIGETWRVKSVIGAGGTIELANSTRWAISGPDMELVQGWKNGEIIEIQTNNNKTWPYLLINTQRRQQAAAQYTGTR